MDRRSRCDRALRDGYSLIKKIFCFFRNRFEIAHILYIFVRYNKSMN